MNRIAAGMTALLLVCALSTAAAVADRRTPVVAAVEKVAPAVVNISTSIRQRVNPFRGRSPLSEFFGDLFVRPRTVERESLGSGVIIRSDGYILTNNHVIDGASQIRVALADQREFEAEIIGADARSDLAVIKVESDKPLPVAPMGRSDDIMVGETVIAIGNPFGLSHTVTTGIISAVGRTIRGQNGKVYQDFIQLDASINPGNSGGAVLNIDGELIGITTAIYRAAEGIGFAIPVDRARRIVDDLINYGKVHHGYIGLFVDDLNPRLARRMGWREKGGALVTKIMGDGPAFRAGIKPGDIIWSVTGKRIASKRDFNNRLASFTGGDRIGIGLFSGGERRTVELEAEEITGPVADRIAQEWLGVEVKAISRALEMLYRLPATEGVVIVEIEPGSELASVGVEPGDVIRRINRTNIKTIEDFRSAVAEGQFSTTALVFIQRGRNIYQISIGG